MDIIAGTTPENFWTGFTVGVVIGCAIYLLVMALVWPKRKKPDEMAGELEKIKSSIDGMIASGNELLEKYRSRPEPISSGRVLREYRVGLGGRDVHIVQATNGYIEDGFFWFVDENTDPSSDVLVVPVHSVDLVLVVKNPVEGSNA